MTRARSSSSAETGSERSRSTSRTVASTAWAARSTPVSIVTEASPASSGVKDEASMRSATPSRSFTRCTSRLLSQPPRMKASRSR